MMILKEREEQVVRVIEALRDTPKERAISILCYWMPMDAVERMIKALEAAA